MKGPTGTRSSSMKFIIVTALLAAAIVFISSVLITISYKRTLVRYLNEYLEEHLLTRLSMDEDIRFRFLKGFPNTTVEISNILLSSGADFSAKDFTETYSDTLLYAKSAYLKFNPFKLLRKDYELKRIQISHAKINVLIDKNGRNNLKIWQSEKRESGGYSLNLKSIVFSDTQVRIRSVKNNLDFLGRSIKTTFKGKLSSNVLSGETKGQFDVTRLSYRDKLLASNSDLLLEINMVVSGERFRISKGTVQLNKALAGISGEIISGRNASVDLSVNLPHFGLNELMSVIPWSFKPVNYEFDGKGNLNMSINGPLRKKGKLNITSSFILENGTARNITTKSSFTGLFAKGSSRGTHAENFSLKIDTFYARFGKGRIDGNISITDINKLLFHSDIKADLNLKEFAEFTGQNSFELSGSLNTNLKAAGSLKDIVTDSVITSLKLLKSGVFVFDNAGFRNSRGDFSVQKITGKTTWGENVSIDSLSLVLNETEILLSGELGNVRSYLMAKDYLKPELLITSDLIDISRYLKRDRKTNLKKDGSGLPGMVFTKARIFTRKLVAGKFEASDMTLNLTIAQDSMHVDNFNFSFPDGSIQGTGLLKKAGPKEIEVNCNAYPEGINITDLFYVFNNFTQDFIIDKNLKGHLSGSVNFYARWDSTLKIIPGSVKALGDIKITNGELVQFDPMMKLSKYIDLEELRHIKFKTLKNSIYISDRTVSIPEMDINSSAFNIRVSGEHSFDNVFDYRLRVLLSEVLFNKARKKKKEIDEFFVEETPADQTTIPLIIAGTPKDFDVKFDRKKAFGLSRSKNQVKEKPETGAGSIRVEWEKPGEVKEKKPVKSGESQDVVIEWEE